MSESIEYALGALLLYGVADFVYKRGAAAGAEPHHFLMVQTWFFTPCALLYGLASGTLVFNVAALWGAVAGVCAVIGYYNFAHSLRSGSVSTNATIFRLSFAVTVALAVLVLKEPLTAPKVAGLVLVVAAMVVGSIAEKTDAAPLLAGVAKIDIKLYVVQAHIGRTVGRGFEHVPEFTIDEVNQKTTFASAFACNVAAVKSPRSNSDLPPGYT